MFLGGLIVGGLHHQPVKGATAERVDTDMGTLRTVFHKHIITVLFDQGGNQMIDKGRVYEGCIRRYPHDDIGIELFGCTGITRQHVIFGPTHHDNAFLIAPFHNRLVGGVDAGGYRNVFEQPACFQAVDDVPQKRFAGDVGFKTLPGRRMNPIRACITATTRIFSRA